MDIMAPEVSRKRLSSGERNQWAIVALCIIVIVLVAIIMWYESRVQRLEWDLVEVRRQNSAHQGEVARTRAELAGLREGYAVLRHELAESRRLQELYVKAIADSHDEAGAARERLDLAIAAWTEQLAVLGVVFEPSSVSMFEFSLPDALPSAD